MCINFRIVQEKNAKKYRFLFRSFNDNFILFQIYEKFTLITSRLQRSQKGVGLASEFLTFLPENLGLIQPKNM